MTNEEMILLNTIRKKVFDKPDFLNAIISAATQGAKDRADHYQQMACDMETITSTAIMMMGEKRVTKSVKDHFEKLALAKLTKYLPDKSFFKWDWALEKKDEVS